MAVSRKLMRNHATQHTVDPTQDPRVPSIIRGLAPICMEIINQQLRGELQSGFNPSGFVAEKWDTWVCYLLILVVSHSARFSASSVPIRSTPCFK